MECDFVDALRMRRKSFLQGRGNFWIEVKDKNVLGIPFFFIFGKKAIDKNTLVSLQKKKKNLNALIISQNSFFKNKTKDKMLLFLKNGES